MRRVADEASFQVELRYAGWPITDVLTRDAPPGDGWTGEGRVFGIPFCRFRLAAR